MVLPPTVVLTDAEAIAVDDRPDRDADTPFSLWIG